MSSGVVVVVDDRGGVEEEGRWCVMVAFRFSLFAFRFLSTVCLMPPSVLYPQTHTHTHTQRHTDTHTHTHRRLHARLLVLKNAAPSMPKLVALSKNVFTNEVGSRHHECRLPDTQEDAWDDAL